MDLCKFLCKSENDAMPFWSVILHYPPRVKMSPNRKREEKEH